MHDIYHCKHILGLIQLNRVKCLPSNDVLATSELSQTPLEITTTDDEVVSSLLELSSLTGTDVLNSKDAFPTSPSLLPSTSLSSIGSS